MGDPNPFKPLKRTRLPKPNGFPNFGFDVGFVIKDWFFNSDNVKKHLTDNEIYVLSKFGAYTRTVARRSMKRRAQFKINRKTGNNEDQTGKPGYASAPGEPPHAHAFGKGLDGGLRYGAFNVVYGFNPKRNSVVIGPRNKPTNNRFIPMTLEYGGTQGSRPNPKRRVRKVGSAGVVRIESPKAGRGGTAPGSNPRKIRALNGHTYDVFFAKLLNARMVARCDRLETFIWGPKRIPTANIAARPYMRPAFAVAQTMLPKFWADARAREQVRFTGG